MGIWRLTAALALVATPVLVATPALAEPVTGYGTQQGALAYDADPYGGNPFASAVIAALADPGDDTPYALEVNTGELSGGYQIADASQLGDLRLRPAEGEQAVALVVVFADYGDVEGLPSLPGAAFDAVRMADALIGAGYLVVMRVPHTAEEYRTEVQEFGETSARFDRALIYTTGHGISPDGHTFLLRPDIDALANPGPGDGIGMDEVGQSLKAKATNLLLYAGCREDLMPHEAAQAVRNRQLR